MKFPASVGVRSPTVLNGTESPIQLTPLGMFRPRVLESDWSEVPSGVYRVVSRVRCFGTARDNSVAFLEVVHHSGISKAKTGLAVPCVDNRFIEVALSSE